MSPSYTLSRTESLVRCELSGPLELGGTQELFRDLCARGNWPEGWGVLVDTTRREQGPRGPEMQALVLLLEMLSSQQWGPVALVTSWPDQFGMARMLEIRAVRMGLRFAAFKEEAMALRWLGRGGWLGLRGEAG